MAFITEEEYNKKYGTDGLELGAAPLGADEAAAYGGMVGMAPQTFEEVVATPPPAPAETGRFIGVDPDLFLTREQADLRRSIYSSLELSLTENPDQFAAYMDQAKETGLPLELFGNKEIQQEANRLIQAKGLEEFLSKGSGKLREWVLTPQNFEVSKDDTENLTNLESMLHADSPFMYEMSPYQEKIVTPELPSRMMASFQGKYYSTRLGVVEGQAVRERAGQLRLTTSPQEIARSLLGTEEEYRKWLVFRAKEMEYRYNDEDLNWAERLIVGAAGQIGQYTAWWEDSIPTGMLYHMVGTGLLAGTGVGAGAALAVGGASYLAPKLWGSLAQWLSQFQDIWNSETYVNVLDYQRMQDITGKKISLPDIEMAASLTAIPQAALEYLGQMLVFRNVPVKWRPFRDAASKAVVLGALEAPSKMPMVRYLLQSGAAFIGELAEEGLQKLTGSIGGRLLKGYTGQPFVRKEWSEDVYEALSEAKEAVWSFGLLHFLGMGSGLTTYVESYRDQQASYEAFRGIAEGTSLSLLHKRSQEKYKEAVDTITKDGPKETTYIDIRRFNTYWQSKGIDPRQAADDLGIADQYDQAVAELVEQDALVDVALEEKETVRTAEPGTITIGGRTITIDETSDITEGESTEGGIRLPGEKKRILADLEEEIEDVAPYGKSDNPLTDDSGIDLAIPTSAYAAQIAGTEHHAGLVNDLKFSADGMTARQATEQQKRVSDWIANAMKKFSGQRARLQDVQQVFLDKLSQILDDPQEAADASRLYALAAMQAEEAGAIPDALEDAKGLVFQRDADGKIQGYQQNAGEWAYGGLVRNPALKRDLTRAKIMRTKGKRTADYIYRETGWFVGPDGQWRFVIDDSKARIIDDGSGRSAIQRIMDGDANGFNLHVEELMDHPDLFNAYPYIAGMSITIMDGESGASFGGYPPSISMGTLSVQRDASEKTDAEVLNDLLHEIQHGIQGYEGIRGDWARGGSMKMIEDRVDALKESYSKASGEERSKLEAELAKLGYAPDDEHGFGKLYDAYLRIWGEVEARVTETRSKYTEEQLSSETPMETAEKVLRNEGLLTGDQTLDDVLLFPDRRNHLNVQYAWSIPERDVMYDEENDTVFYQAAKQKASPIDLVPGVSRIFTYLTDAERAKVKEQTVNSLMAFYGSLPDAEEIASIAWSGRAKKGWYRRSNKAIMRIFGLDDAPRFTALLAALSPQTSVPMNLLNALNAWNAWVRAGRPTDNDAILKILGDTVQGDKGEESVLGAWRNNAYRALTSVDPISVILSGPKVDSFMRNLLGDMMELTNDTWVAIYFAWEQVMFSGIINKSETEPGKGPGYLAVNAKFSEGAEILTKRTGELWEPAEIQETIWSWTKALLEKAESAGEDRTTLEILEAGDLTHDMINSVPDFEILFAEGVYRKILEEGGYGEQVRAVAGDVESRAGDGGYDGVGGNAASAEGAGIAEDAFKEHLRAASERIELVRRRRAGKTERADNWYQERQRFAGLLAYGKIKGKPASPYGRGNKRSRRRVAGLEVAAVKYKPTEVFASHMAYSGDTAPVYYEITGQNAPQAFHDSIAESVKKNRFGTSVTIKDASEYKGMRLFVTEDGDAGFAITKKGDLVSVFATPGVGGPKIGSILFLALKEGARTLDCYDTILPHNYAQAGFRPISRTAWDDREKPEGWDYDQYEKFNGGRPDIVAMVFDPDYFHDYAGPSEGIMVGSYDEAIALRDEALKKLKGGEKLKDTTLFQSSIDTDYLAAVEAAIVAGEDNDDEIEVVQEMVYKAAEDAGYGFSHRRNTEKDPRSTGHVILFARDRNMNEGYGDYEYVARLDLLSKVPDWAIEWHANSEEMKEWAEFNEVTNEDEIYEQAYREMNPNKIVDTALFWDDPGAISRFWEENEDRLVSEKIAGFKTPDGAVVFDAYNHPEVVKSAAPISYDDAGNVIPLSERFDSKKPDIRYQTDTSPRGAYTVTGEGERIITLFSKADASTVIHEFLGHHIIERYLEAERLGTLSEQAKADMDVLRSWAGSTDGTLSVDQKEQIAEAWEKYLMEGKAPSAEIAGVFERFKRKLLEIYRVIRSRVSQIILTDELISVFDRMLIAQDELDDLKELQGYDEAVRFAEESGASEEDVQALARLVSQADIEAHKDVTEQLVAPVVTRLKTTIADRRKKLKAEMTEAVRNSPVYRMRNTMRKPGSTIKFAKQEILDTWGEEGLQAFKGFYAVNGTISLDEAVGMFGFESSTEMRELARSAPSVTQAIRDAVTRKLADELTSGLHGDAMKEITQMALHSETRLEAIILERLILDSRTTEQNMAAAYKARSKALLAHARRQLLSRKAKGLNPKKYFSAEARWQRKYEEAVRDGDLDAARQAKDLQGLNFAMGMASMEASKALKKADKDIRKYARRGRKTLGLPLPVLDAIDNLLERVDLRGRNKDELQVIRELEQYVNTQQQKGETPMLPPETLRSLGKKRYQEMSVGEVLELGDTIRSLVHIGQFEQKMLSAELRQKFDELVFGLVEQGGKTKSHRKGETINDATFYEPVLRGLREFHDAHMKVDFLINILDRASSGSFRDAIWNPLNNAAGREQQMLADAAATFKEIMTRRHTKQEVRRWRKQRLNTDGAFDATFTKENLLMIALNWGNGTNRDRVMVGYDVEGEQVEALFDKYLEERDWQMVQDIWDFINTFWPEIEKLHADMTGVRPAKVEATPVQTKYGEFAGGYFPIAYSKKLSHAAFFRAQKEEDLLSTNYFGLHTAAGHTKLRMQSVGQQFKLELHLTPVLGLHLRRVIHDLAFRRALRDVNRIVTDESVAATITDVLGSEGYRQFRPWLIAIAGTQFTPVEGWGRFIARAKTGATVVSLGLRFAPAISQIFGYLATATHVGTLNTLKYLTDFLTHPMQWSERAEFVKGKSQYMKFRESSFDQDVTRTIAHLTENGMMDSIKEAFFAHIGMMDAMVTIPTWYGVYHDALAEGLSETQAVEKADTAIRQTQNTGRVIDTSAIQRGHPALTIFTMFYSYMNTLYNMHAVALNKIHSVKDVPRYLSFLMLAFVLEGIGQSLLRGNGPDDDDDDGVTLWEWISWGAKNTLGNITGTMVGIRDIFGVMNGYRYQFSPAVAPVEQFSRLVSAVLDLNTEDPDTFKKVLKTGWGTAEYWWGIPTKQVRQSAGHILDAIFGDEEFSLRKFIYNR